MIRLYLRSRKLRKPQRNSPNWLSAGYVRALAVESLEHRTLLSVTLLNTLSTPDTGATAKNPQSKVWQHDGLWWSVLPVTSSGTWLTRLDGATWTPVLQLSSSRLAADVKPVGDGTIAHVLLFNSGTSKLASLEYVPGSPGTYQFWHVRTALASIPISSGANTATIDIDSTGRMWEANDATSTVEVHYSDSPYSSWSGPITLATGIGTIDNGSSQVSEDLGDHGIAQRHDRRDVVRPYHQAIWVSRPY